MLTPLPPPHMGTWDKWRVMTAAPTHEQQRRQILRAVCLNLLRLQRLVGYRYTPHMQAPTNHVCQQSVR